MCYSGLLVFFLQCCIDLRRGIIGHFFCCIRILHLRTYMMLPHVIVVHNVLERTWLVFVLVLAQQLCRSSCKNTKSDGNCSLCSLDQPQFGYSTGAQEQQHSIKANGRHAVV